MQFKRIRENKKSRGITDNKVIGEKIDDGVVVFKSYAEKYLAGDAKHSLDDIKKTDAEDISKFSGNASNTKLLRKGIGKPQPKNFQAHHVIPREIGTKFKKFFEDIGFDIENGAINGIMMPPNKKVLDAAKLDVDIPIGTKLPYTFYDLCGDEILGKEKDHCVATAKEHCLSKASVLVLF